MAFKNYLSVRWVLILLMVFVVPNLALAAGSDFFGLNSVQNLFCSGGGLACSKNLFELLNGVIHLLLLFTGSLAVLFVIIGGYFYITSGGNEQQAEKGKRTLINAVIGIVVILMSNAIVMVITNTINSP